MNETSDSTKSRLTQALEKKIQLPVILSAIAVIVSVGNSVWTLAHDPLRPLGRGIGAYDFSTPEAAITSQSQIVVNRDLRAWFDIALLRSLDPDARRLATEQIKTLKVHKRSTYQGKKILFVSYDKNGIKEYDIQSFEKDADTGKWFPAYVSTYKMDDKRLENAIKEWKEKSPTSQQFKAISSALK